MKKLIITSIAALALFCTSSVFARPYHHGSGGIYFSVGPGYYDDYYYSNYRYRNNPYYYYDNPYYYNERVYKRCWKRHNRVKCRYYRY